MVVFCQTVAAGSVSRQRLFLFPGSIFSQVLVPPHPPPLPHTPIPPPLVTSCVETGNESFMHIVDLYATLLGRAGIDPADGDSPAPIDSLDMWDWWSGASPVSPRTTAVLDHDMFNVSGNGVTGGEPAPPRQIASWRR